MFNAHNGLSFVRAPLAFLFLQENATLRVVAVLLAMITDSIDGYIARRSSKASTFGAILDPVMDKFFVYVSVAILSFEHKIESWHILAILSRDAFLFLHGFLMLIGGRFKEMKIRSVKWGKITTALQFCVLIALALNFEIPTFIYLSFIAMGYLAFLELHQTRQSVTLT